MGAISPDGEDQRGLTGLRARPIVAA
jgi:hypothetical protein